jgi:hypothetical protein
VKGGSEKDRDRKLAALMTATVDDVASSPT